MATSFDSTLASLGISRTNPTATAAASSKGVGQMDQSDFIALMTAQMKNQDPFDPVDNTQMVAQMAQFSSLAGISEMSSTLKAISEKLGATSSSDALSFVGKTALSEGSVAYPRTSGGFAGAIELDGAATAVNVTISNANGEVLKSVNLGAHAAGTVNYDWDGTTDSGTPAGDGPFTVTANARDGGKTVGSRTLVWAPVTSVSLPAGSEPVLNLAGIGAVKASAVRSFA
ncbi:flagellar hook assembly protein FlgD [Sphingomonas donggukensis]|uniref:Basal-body rod modification protein FlgD n=1 Tax=Sphingomonas donggukensis TaxID=2949093 RepID=A0ABY4TT02_9SPHN|nr:flagellar hook capping FlgD N-terminal domain-containing protein [Sphingomonas donggukensis]URW75540.1 flagellar hook assembly protein FlgD [Sphingomonas donggukensis]